VTEPSDPSATPSDVARLLLKAVNALPEDERAAVLEYFFERGIGMEQPALLGQFLRGAQPRAAPGPGAWPEPAALATLFGARKPVGPDRIMIPVRLSEAQHRRLKEWCADHDFPMSVVVRGLIDRFLDGWEKRAPEA
jgi:hypothetical protein